MATIFLYYLQLTIRAIYDKNCVIFSVLLELFFAVIISSFQNRSSNLHMSKLVSCDNTCILSNVL